MKAKSWYLNTDTVDMELGQIGLHFFLTKDREFNIGVKHNGTSESIKEAVRLAGLIQHFLNTSEDTK